MARVDLSGWSLIPGPLFDPPRCSTELHDLVVYPAELVAEALLAFPGMQVTHQADSSWWSWSARWTSEDGHRSMDVNFTLLGEEPPTWGGSEIEGACELSDILAFWEVVRRQIPACWMHDWNCRILSPDEFREEFAG